MGQPIRVPNLPVGKMVEESGEATAEEQMFRQALITLLQKNFNVQGVVVPSQTQANLTIIQNNVVTTPNASTSVTNYSTQFGTLLYKPSTTVNPAIPNDYLAVAMDDGTANQAPVFKRIMEFDDATLYPTAGAILGYGLINFNGAKYKIALYDL